MYQLIPTTKFKQDLKKIKTRQGDFAKVSLVLEILTNEGVEGVPSYMKPHKLKGSYKDNWECHIKPDLLIIWIQFESPKVIRLVRIGSHSDLFK